MKINSLYNLLFSLLLILITFSAKSQGIYFGSDSQLKKGDTARLYINSYRGDLQWQKSLNRSSWIDVTGATNDSLFYVVDTSVYLRAKITEGSCAPIFSDTAVITMFKLLPDVILVDTLVGQVVSDSTQISQGSFILVNSSDTIKVGDVLVSGQGYGYIRVVNNVIKSGDTLFVSTVQGNLENIIGDMNISDSLLMLVNSGKMSMYHGKPVPMKIKYMRQGAFLKNKGSGLDLTDLVLFSGEVSGATVEVKITNGNIDFEPMFKRHLKLSVWNGIEEVGLSASGSINFECDLQITTTGTVSYQNEINILQALHLGELEYGPIFIGPVPMYIGLDFTAGFNSSITASGIVTTGCKADAYMETGASYQFDGNPQWTPIWEKNASFSQNPFTFDFDGNAHAKAYVTAKIKVTLASIAGPYLEAEPYLDFNANVNLINWDWLLKGGLDSKLGFTVDILGNNIADYNIDLVNWETDISSNNGTFAVLPTILTAGVTNITATTAISGGTVSDDGGSAVTSRGVCWSTSSNPTTSNSQTSNGTGTGVFVSNLSGLTQNTQYYVRAYASNEVGTAYGNEVIFTAGQTVTSPIVTTATITNLTQTTATSGGNVTSGGGGIVSARGVCWSTASNPTITGSHTTNGTGTGSFTGNLTGLTANTPYYVRAYATNSAGTAYGNEVSFTTLPGSGFACGSSITINHVAGEIAPVSKTVTYGTVSNIPGETTKCWITSNLGADHQATAVNDATEASAG